MEVVADTMLLYQTRSESDQPDDTRIKQRLVYTRL